MSIDSESNEENPANNSESSPPSLFAGYSVVQEADFAIQRDLEEWSQIAADNSEQSLLLTDSLRARILSNARLISIISEDVLFEPENFRGVRDKNGNLQAGAVVENTSDYLYLHYLVTAPWNIRKNTPRSVREAATVLLVELIKESISYSHEGQIVVNAVANSPSFYERIGFILTAEGSTGAPEMVLIPEVAKSLIKRKRNP